jgi:hypothetical protein
MKKYLRCLAVAGLIGGVAGPASAGELKLTMANGRVTLIADEVPVRQILVEWARVGETKIVNGEKLIGPPVTLQLIDVPEGQALDIVLKSAAGYMAAPRTAEHPGPSVYDRIMILATSRPPAITASAPPTFNRPPMPQPMPEPAEEQEQQEEPDVVPAPNAMPPNVQPQPGMPTQPQSQPGMPQQQPQPDGQQPPQQPVTSPRPGPIPMSPVPGNPYVPYRPPTRPGGGGGQ